MDIPDTVVMDRIRELVWDGAINVQINVNPALLLNGVSYKESVANIRLPRETYLVLYLPSILDRLRHCLKIDTDQSDVSGNTYWFEFEKVALFWNYPLGILYDSMSALNPAERFNKDDENSINVWKIELMYGSSPPNGVIPLIDGMAQIRSYWMHQWKQSCYILNGSAKQVMSLSMQESQQFWDCILSRNRIGFDSIRNKIVPKRPKSIPIVLHQTLPDIRRLQPSITEFKEDGSPETLGDMAKKQFPEFFQDKKILMKAVSNGIELPLESKLFELYRRFLSFDGFLHICICLVTNEEYIDG